MLAGLAATSAHAAVVISNDATKHMSCSAGVCSPTAKNAVLNAGDLSTMLATSDVKVATGAGAVAIGVSAPVTWTSANRLTLDANQGVSVKAAVVSEGAGGLTVTLNDGGSGGNLMFFPGGSITFWDNSSSLIIAGNLYTLVSDIATLAAGVASNPSGFYALAKDYDATGDGAYSDAAVPTALTGAFEGLGHTINHFTMSVFDSFQIGLFAEIDGAARDLTMTGGSISCDLDNSDATVGLLVGTNTGSLANISVAGAVNCARADHVGGLAGDNTAGTIAKVTTAVTIGSGKAHYAGGVVGVNSGMIENASASNSVFAGGAYAGGLVGYSTGLVQDSHATGGVSVAQGENLGGLAGYAQGAIEHCYATGSVSGNKMAGGLVGYASGVTIDGSFATGSASSAQDAGGLVGYTGPTVQLTNSYARGAATASAPRKGIAGGLVGLFANTGSVAASYATGAPGGGRYLGGLAGSIAQSPTMTDAYWDLDTSGISDPSRGAGNVANYPGIAGQTTAQFQSALPAGFDPAVWAENGAINGGYPYLIANPPP
jgi:hypothetical protein